MLKIWQICFFDKVIFGAVLFAQNMRSICELPRVAAEIGIHRIGITQVRMHELCVDNGITPPKYPEILYCIDTLFENANKYNVKLVFDKSFHKYIKQYTIGCHDDMLNINKINNGSCKLPWTYTSILSDGSLFPCCGDFQPQPVKLFSFDGIFNHDYLSILRRHIKIGQTPNACIVCHHV